MVVVAAVIVDEAQITRYAKRGLLSVCRKEEEQLALTKTRGKGKMGSTKYT